MILTVYVQLYYVRNYNWLNLKKIIGSIDPEKTTITTSGSNNSCYATRHWIVQKLNSMYKYMTMKHYKTGVFKYDWITLRIKNVNQSVIQS